MTTPYDAQWLEYDDDARALEGGSVDLRDDTAVPVADDPLLPSSAGTPADGDAHARGHSASPSVPRSTLEAPAEGGVEGPCAESGAQDVARFACENGEGRPRMGATGKEVGLATAGVSFVVPGAAAPQGSKTKTRWGVREDNPATLPWRNAVAAAATKAARDQQAQKLLRPPLALKVRFYFARPKGHYGTGRNAGLLKPSAPTWKGTAPDLDKLVRAIGDACKGIVYVDDAAIVYVEASKFYGSPRAEITITTLEEIEREKGGSS